MNGMTSISNPPLIERNTSRKPMKIRAVPTIIPATRIWLSPPESSLGSRCAGSSCGSGGMVRCFLCIRETCNLTRETSKFCARQTEVQAGVDRRPDMLHFRLNRSLNLGLLSEGGLFQHGLDLKMLA